MNELASKKNKSAILLMHCPDQKGIIASVTNFIKENNGNILYLDQHVDSEDNVFFMRVEWELENFVIDPDELPKIFAQSLGKKYQMKWAIHFSDSVLRMAVFVSHLPHCLYDILSRSSSGEWNIEVPLIISNHAKLENVAKQFGIDYHHIPVTTDTKQEAEIKQLNLLNKYQIDFVVLARYMQILSPDFIAHHSENIINIHHSFLPAFPGAKPYHSAHKRGVKIIGATSHYVTNELDEGPIIDQDVVHISHVDSIGDLIRKGRDLEKIVLSRAVHKHNERKVLVYKNRTIIFD